MCEVLRGNITSVAIDGLQSGIVIVFKLLFRRLGNVRNNIVTILYNYDSIAHFGAP